MAYKNHSKFIYKNYDEIQNAINNDEIDIYDIVFTKDTKEIVLITDNYNLHAVKSRVYRFQSIEQAEEMINQRSDTYEGQIVAIINGSSYTGYIVNKNRGGKYYVTALNGYGGVINYNTLGERPIINMYGTLDEPIVISGLDTGIYKITGQYFFSPQDPVTHLSMASNLFLVERDDENDNIYIKRISPHDIYDYTLHPDGSVITSVVPTQEWLRQQGYTTDEDLDRKLAALDLITRAEIADYVNSVIENRFELVINQKVAQAIDKTMIPITDAEIINIVRTNDGG